MDKPVLVFILSERCGACINFKHSTLPLLEKELVKNPNLNVVVLNFPDMMIPASNPKVGNYHPGIKNGLVKFFPTMALFPGSLWNNHNSKLQGVVKHGDEENPQIDYSKTSILDWIQTTLKTNPLFSSTVDSSYMVPTYGQFHSSKIDESEL